MPVWNRALLVAFGFLLALEMPLGLKTSQITGPKTAQVTLAFDGVPTTLKVGLNAEIAYAVRAVPPGAARCRDTTLSGDCRSALQNPRTGQPSRFSSSLLRCV